MKQEKLKTKAMAEESLPVVSAGFLLYSYDTQTHNIYFLLGQESYHPEWPYSNRWCDFSGTQKTGETEVECAARELLEETLNCVPLDNNQNINSQHILHLIQTKQYLCRILAHFPSQNHLPARKRICYVKEIPWQPDLPEVFHQQSRLYRPLRHGTTALERMNYWQTLTPEQQNVPFVTLVYERNRLVDVVVKSDWMEKAKLEWWSIPRLHGVIRNEGKYRKTYFRRGFVQLLRVILELFVHVKKATTSDDLAQIVSEIKTESKVVLMASHVPWNHTEPLFEFDV